MYFDYVLGRIAGAVVARRLAEDASILIVDKPFWAAFVLIIEIRMGLSFINMGLTFLEQTMKKSGLFYRVLLIGMIISTR